MAENKTKKNKASVTQFINSIEDPQRKKDSKIAMKLMKKVTGEKAEMWGTSIVGFGTYQYKYASGREGEFMTVGFSPRKQALTLYIMAGFSKYDKLMNKLGKFKTGKSCLYVKKMEDVDLDALEELVTESVTYIRNKKWP